MRQYIIFFAALLVTGCSGAGSSAISPESAPAQAVARLDSQHPGRTISSYSCPATGPIVYVSDYTNSVINVYKGDLKGQPPCGQLGSRSTLIGPSGLYVQTATHDLYVANGGISSIAVFHRGQSTPYNSYLDQSHQYVHFQDVTVAKDGTVIANSDCSLSTWISGPNGGKFVGNFGKKNCQPSYASAITINDDDVLYYDGLIGGGFNPYPAVFTLSCPAGVCGPQKKLEGLRPALFSPQGMAFDAAGNLLIAVNVDHPIKITLTRTSAVETFKLPSPVPKVFLMTGIVYGIAVNVLGNRLFVAKILDGAAEYSYPRFGLIGTAPTSVNGYVDGVAVDQ